ncbi:MAG: hypothetical protein ABJA60_08030, partial [Nitrosospira sp.]
QELANQLVNLALQKGGEDNITVQLIEYGRALKRKWSKIIGRFRVVVPAAWGLPAIAASGCGPAGPRQVNYVFQRIGVFSRLW